MKALTFKLAFLAMLCCSVFSCQQLPEDDGWMADSDKQSLKVKVRSAGDAEIEYPLYLYAFFKDGKLAATQVIESADEQMSLLLNEGDFKIVALSGISTSYQLPDNPTLTDVVSLEETTGADTPLMMGKADVSISTTSNASVEMTLTYVVSALNVTLKDVPSNISAVQLSLSPLYSTLSMAGVYGGESQKVKVDCIQTSDGIWSAPTTYIFPGSGKETVFSIYFKMDDGTEITYGHTFNGAPEANHLFNVTGSYSGGIVVGGTFDVTDWEGSIDVEFTFGANVVPDDEEDESDEPEIDMSKVPEVGSIWNGTIVADIGEADDSGVDLLLMSLDEWEATTSQVGDVLDGYSVNGISDWRLPTHDEAAVLRVRFSGDARLDLNDLIAEYDETLYGLDGEERYLCTKSELYYSFKFMAGTTTTKAGEVRSYYVRLVKTFRFDIDGD